MKDLSVSIVIPNWNGREKLKNNLKRVLAVKAVDEVVIADDASTDGSINLIKEEFPTVKLIERKKNGGFSSNVNDGVRAAKGDLIFLLNSDAVPSVDCLEAVLPHFENSQVFSVGCNVGGGWSWARWSKGWFWHNQMGKETDTLWHQTLWASGGSGVFRKDLWVKMGGLDESMNPFYVEDVDLGYRATKRGYINIFEPKSKVEHYKEKGVIEENFSKKKVSDTAERNTLIFIWKNISDTNMLVSHLWYLVLRLIRHPKYWLIFMGALIRLPKILGNRAIELKNQKVTDQDIFSKFVME
jgi:GT2 family glycosyltransferase